MPDHRLDLASRHCAARRCVPTREPLFVALGHRNDGRHPLATHAVDWTMLQRDAVQSVDAHSCCSGSAHAVVGHCYGYSLADPAERIPGLPLLPAAWRRVAAQRGRWRVSFARRSSAAGLPQSTGP